MESRPLGPEIAGNRVYNFGPNGTIFGVKIDVLSLSSAPGSDLIGPI